MMRTGDSMRDCTKSLLATERSAASRRLWDRLRAVIRRQSRLNGHPELRLPNTQRNHQINGVTSCGRHGRLRRRSVRLP